MNQEPESWVDSLTEWALHLMRTRLGEHFPDGIPAEVTDAVARDVTNIFRGKPVHMFNLRRLVLSTVNEGVARFGPQS